MFHVAYKSLINLFKVIEPKSPKKYMIEKKNYEVARSNEEKKSINVVCDGSYGTKMKFNSNSTLRSIKICGCPCEVSLLGLRFCGQQLRLYEEEPSIWLSFRFWILKPKT